MILKSDAVLVTGCAGALGEAVHGLFRDRCAVAATDRIAEGAWCRALDVTSSEAVRGFCDEIRPAAIINLAAMTDLEGCEREPVLAYETNGWAVGALVAEARRRDIPLVHISTAGVFNGLKDSYSEDDAYLAMPLNMYGKSKLVGELLALAYPKSIVIRSGWMIGGGPAKDRKFVSKILRQIRAGAREISAVDDKLGTPSYTYDIARLIWDLLQKNAHGLYHGCCSGGATRADIARFAVSRLGMDRSVAVRTVASDHFKNEYFARRPRSEQLHTVRDTALRPWQECLAEYLERFPW